MNLVLILAAFGLPRPAAGQVLYGSLVGHVIDSTDAALPGALITIVHEETQATRETVSDAAGAYRFPTIPTGTYGIRVRLPGFSPLERSGVPVSLNGVTRVDLALQLGEVAEALTVDAATPLLQSDRAEVRADFSAAELQNLPVPVGRSYQNLFRVLPGVTPPAVAHSVPSNPSRALAFNVNGASRSSNNIRVDGVSTNHVFLPHIAAYVPALESIEGVNVVTNSFDAEQGLAGGAAINVQIRSGTNDLRASVFAYHSNEALRANNYFAPPGTPKGAWQYDQLGGTAGGPVRRDRLFYFVSYERTRDQRHASRTVTVPTEPLRRGDLSSAIAPIYDPATGSPDGTGRTAFSGNVIPPDRIHPLALEMVRHLPLPNLPGEQNNYFVQAPFVFSRWTVDSKVTYSATRRLNVFARHSMLDFDSSNATVFGDVMQGPPIFAGSNAGIGEGGTHSMSAGATYSVGSNLVLDTHVGWMRVRTQSAPTDLGEHKGRDWLGLPGTNGSRRFEGGMPLFNVVGYAAWGVVEPYLPYFWRDDQVQHVVNMTWLKGRHSIRWGSDINYQALNHTQPEFIGTSFGARGGFEFSAGPTLLRGGPAETHFNSWAAFLLGLPTRTGRVGQMLDPYTTRNRQYSVYVRDQWQATPKLTVTYGVRWEYFPMPARKDRGLERYNPADNTMYIGGVDGVPKNVGVQVSPTMFAPRFGVAYRVSAQAVVRGGFGLTNDPYSLARPMRTNHPILLNVVESAPHAWGWVGPLSAGVPLIPDPDLRGGNVPVPGNVGVFTLPDRFERGHIKSWNAAYQRELRWGIVGEAAYVATRQANQLGYRELNWSPIGGGEAGRQLNQRFGRTAQTRVVAPIGNTTYHALQTRLERRLANGIQAEVNYTLSRSHGIATAPDSDNPPRIQIPEYYHLNYGLSAFDRTHVLHVTSIVELPFGSGRRWLSTPGVLSAVTGGWQVNTILSRFSGTPFSVFAGAASLNAPESGQQADLLVEKPRILGGRGRRLSYFDPLAFAPVTDARFGTAPLNLLRGPGHHTWDLGLFRELRLRGDACLQARFEAFNVINAPRFNNPGNNVSDLQRNPDGTIRSLNGFSEITSTVSESERVMRLGVRLSF